MTTIKYTPITGGQAFGNPADLFRGAAQSLNQATQGASKAFNTIRQGSIDARDQRTQDVIGAIQAAQTPEEYSFLAGQFANPNDIAQQFGGAVDFNKIGQALRAQEGAIQQRQDDQYARENLLGQRADTELQQKLYSDLRGKSSAEINDILSKSSELGFRNQVEGDRFLTQLRDNAIEGERNQFLDMVSLDPALQVPETGSNLSTFDARNQRLKSYFDQAVKSGLIKANQRSDMEKQFKDNLGLTSRKELQLISDSLGPNASRNDFVNAAERRGISVEAAGNYIDAIEKAKGIDEKEAEEKHQRRRKEALEDIEAKSATPAELQKYINETFTDTDFIYQDALDEANEAVATARAAKLSNRLIAQAVYAATEIRGDFNIEQFNRVTGLNQEPSQDEERSKLQTDVDKAISKFVPNNNPNSFLGGTSIRNDLPAGTIIPNTTISPSNTPNLNQALESFRARYPNR